VQVIVINLDEDRDRLCRFQANMKQLNVPFQRWSATRGAELDHSKFGKEPVESGIYIKDFKEWSMNEAACGVSHIRALQHIVREGIPYTIVMEDDGILRQSVPLDAVAWELPQDADIVLLNDRAAVGTIRERGDVYSYGDVAGGAGTEGYLVSLQGATKLLEVLYPLREPLDFQMYAHFKSIRKLDRPPYYWSLPRNPEAASVLLNAYRVVPSLVMHSDDDSTIGNQRHPRAHYYCRVLLGLHFGDQPLDYHHTHSPRALGVFTPPSESTCTRAAVDKIIWRGVDISHYDEKTQFVDAASARPRDLMAILRDNGVNIVRVSLWVGSNTMFNLERALRLARQAREQGLRLCLALHYSDTWADPRHQHKPADWASLPMGELTNRMYTYTRDVIGALREQGTPPAVVQLGNEITNGMLWAGGGEHFAEGGRLSRPSKEGAPLPWESQWHVLAELLRQASKGVRDSMLSSVEDVRIMLHLHKGADTDAAIWWFRKAKEHDIDFDAIGLSFYSLWHRGATLKKMQRLARIARAFPDKEIVLAETAYPYRPYVDSGKVHSAGTPPFSRAGQREYLMRALKVLRQLPNGNGLYWWGAVFMNDALEHCPDCFQAQALFDPSGAALPALEAFKAAEDACDP
jgi:arabinogalactan endo-1,4-beta-galactosidase